MSVVDDRLDRGAAKLEDLSRRAAEAGGVKAKLAQPLAEDAELLRQLKPSRIAARVRGSEPTDGVPSATAPAPAGSRPGESGDGPNPLLVVAALFALGVLLAHVVDWLGDRYPRA